MKILCSSNCSCGWLDVQCAILLDFGEGSKVSTSQRTFRYMGKRDLIHYCSVIHLLPNPMLVIQLRNHSVRTMKQWPNMHIYLRNGSNIFTASTITEPENTKQVIPSKNGKSFTAIRPSDAFTRACPYFESYMPTSNLHRTSMLPQDALLTGIPYYSIPSS